MTVSEVKSHLLDTMDAMDKSRMSVYDLKVYADTLRTLAEVSDKSCTQTISDMLDVMRAEAKPKEGDIGYAV